MHSLNRAAAEELISSRLANKLGLEVEPVLAFPPLPNDITIMIFSYLKFPELGTAAQVTKGAKHLSKQVAKPIWEELCIKSKLSKRTKEAFFAAVGQINANAIETYVQMLEEFNTPRALTLAQHYTNVPSFYRETNGLHTTRWYSTEERNFAQRMAIKHASLLCCEQYAPKKKFYDSLFVWGDSDPQKLYHAALLRINGLSTHLTMPQAYEILCRVNQDITLPGEIRVSAKFYQALLVCKNRILPAPFSYETAFDMLCEVCSDSECPAEIKMRANFYKAYLRVHDLTNKITITEAYELLCLISGNDRSWPKSMTQVSADFHKAVARIYYSIEELGKDKITYDQAADFLEFVRDANNDVNYDGHNEFDDQYDGRNLSMATVLFLQKGCDEDRFNDLTDGYDEGEIREMYMIVLNHEGNSKTGMILQSLLPKLDDYINQLG